MAIYLTPDNVNEGREIFPNDGESFTLEEMQALVGGYVQHIHLPKGRILMLKEDGKMMKLPYNFQASMYAVEAGIADADFAVGNCVVCTRKEAGYDKTDPDE